MNIGCRIASLRRKRRLTQVKLAEATGLNRCYISAIETGKVIPGVKSMAIIANKLGVKIDELNKPLR